MLLDEFMVAFGRYIYNIRALSENKL